VRHRLLVTPRDNTGAWQLTFWLHNELATGGKAQIGRVRVYQAREPINVDGRHVDMVVAAG